ncbi:MAG: class I SAM-dependent methyltransferase [Halioglobus sp.]|nr:class I SAM-dependent methyltransferase [Halioglobus sp.]
MSEYTGTDNLEVMQEAVNYNRFLCELIARHAGSASRVLDFGAGIGTFSARVKEQGFDVTCLEVDAGQAELLQTQGFEVLTSLDDCEDGTFDYVYSLNVLEHIEDDAAAVRQLYRVLRPGATALIYVPALEILFSSMDEKVGHFRRYSRPSLSRLLLDAGFELRTCRYCDSLGFPATLLYKWFGSDKGGISKLPVVLYDRVAFPVSRLLDALFGALLGKNVYAVVAKPDAGATGAAGSE